MDRRDHLDPMMTEAEERVLRKLLERPRAGSRADDPNRVLGTVAARLARRGLVSIEMQSYTTGYLRIYSITDAGRAALRG